MKDLKVAIINEDGPYGVGVAMGNESKCKELGMQIVHKEAYSATATDLSALVTKLRRAQPDVILHTGYNPDITLFLRQAKEANFKFMALIGHGAGYGQIDKLIETFGKDVNYFYNVDPVAAQLLDPKTLKPGVADLTAEMVKRYKAETGAQEVPPHTSMGFNNAWIFLTDVLPRAIKKYGGYDPEALRKAALETDIPEGGTMQGYGVKFFPPGSQMSGQNERSSPVVMQYVDGADQDRLAVEHQDHRRRAAAAQGPRLRAVSFDSLPRGGGWRRRSRVGLATRRPTRSPLRRPSPRSREG